MSLLIENLTVAYGKETVLEQLNLTVNTGEIVAILGNSGSGKTTLLRSIVGLQAIEAGTVWLNNQDIGHMPTHQRNISVVFQDLRLFPHLSVENNLIFPLKMNKIPKDKWNSIVNRSLDAVKLTGFQKRKISQLSGGQKQRIALARALASNPDLLLLDEPFSSLDEPLRSEMQNLVTEIQKDLNLTTILITHDRNEAFQMADKIAYLSDKFIYQFGSQEDFLYRPKDKNVAEFFGETNYFTGQVRGRLITTPLGNFSKPKNLAEGQEVSLMFRPSQINMKLDKEGPWIIKERKVKIDYISYRIVHLQENYYWQTYHNHFTNHGDNFAVGDRIDIEIDTEHIIVVN